MIFNSQILFIANYLTTSIFTKPQIITDIMRQYKIYLNYEECALFYLSDWKQSGWSFTEERGCVCYENIFLNTTITVYHW